MRSLLLIIALLGCSTRTSSHDEPQGGSAPALDPSTPRPAEDMIAIPAGYYPWDTRRCSTAEQYERSARPYKIDRRFVSCAEYNACVDAKQCLGLGPYDCSTDVANVQRSAALKYCAWRGADLPTTGQWQKAARMDGRFAPGGYAPQIDTTCDVSHLAGDHRRCLYTSPYGMIIEMLYSDGEWTKDLSCPQDEDGAGKPLVVALQYRLDTLVTKSSGNAYFRCARTE